MEPAVVWQMHHFLASFFLPIFSYGAQPKIRHIPNGLTNAQTSLFLSKLSYGANSNLHPPTWMQFDGSIFSAS